jgi:hypothetical protein
MIVCRLWPIAREYRPDSGQIRGQCDINLARVAGEVTRPNERVPGGQEEA